MNSLISLQTVVMLLMAAGLVYCFLAIADLRRRLQVLDAKPAPAAPPPPAPAPVAAPAAVAVTATPAPAPAPAAAPTPAPEGLTAEVLAAISAAVHYTLGSGYRVHSVIPAMATASTSWSVEGRRDIFTSHQLR